jgi:hypothetical protein
VDVTVWFDAMRAGNNVRMQRPLLRECAHSECRILTMGNEGALCIRHDPPVATSFPRGRPYALLEETVRRAADAVEQPELIAVGWEAQG